MRMFPRLPFVALGLALCIPPAAVEAQGPTVAWPLYIKPWYANTPSQIFNPTCLALSPRNRVWVSSLLGHIYILEDTNGDGVVSNSEVIQFTTAAQANNHPNLLGLLFLGGDLWVSSTDSTGGQTRIGVYRDTNLDLTPDNTYAPRITGPVVLQHQNNQLVLGPDGWIYLGIGSQGNTTGGSPLNAAIVKFDPAQPSPALQLVASGVRNSFDLCFDLQGNLFGTDNGRDDLGNTLPDEELNHVRPGLDYGFPLESPGLTPPIGTFPAHSSPVGMLFYNHPRIPGLAGEILVMTYKPNFQQIQVGKTLYRAHLTPSGNTFTTTVTPLVTGFDGIATGLDVLATRAGEVLMVEHATVPIRPERILRLSHPYLETSGSGAIGTNLTLSTQGRGGDFQATWMGRPLAQPIPVPPFGLLALDPLLLLFLDAATIPANDRHSRTLPIPNDGSLRGTAVAFQSLVVNGTQPTQGVLTNGPTVQLQ